MGKSKSIESRKAGKLTLLKTTAQVVPNFWMNLFLFPGEICTRIEKLMNAFWWRNGRSGKGVRWMAWKKLCEVKENGGLGFKDLRQFNVSMLAKQGWRLLNNVNPLVTSIMKARYYPNTDFLNAKLGANPSFMWRSIMASQDDVRQGSRKRIGDGLSIRIWEVSWLPDPSNGFITSDLPDELKGEMVQSLMKTDQREWDADVISDIFNDRDGELMQQIILPDTPRVDTWFWLKDDKGKYTV